MVKTLILEIILKEKIVIKIQTIFHLTTQDIILTMDMIIRMNFIKISLKFMTIQIINLIVEEPLNKSYF